MKFRKKPVVIEAFQVPPRGGADTAGPPYWFAYAIVNGIVAMLPEGGAEIRTLEGTMRADVGDWVIKGVKGELYPCKPDVFDATYECADEG